jgi:hypothetical protein
VLACGSRCATEISAVCRRTDRSSQRGVDLVSLVKGEKDSLISRTSFISAPISWFTFMPLLSSLQAQGVATARISGTLTDDSGAVLAGAAVQAKNLEMGSSRSTVTDSGGRFAIADLPIGSYNVRASSPGFDPVVRSAIVLTVGADRVIDFTLKVGQAHQDVIVNAQVSRVETQTGAVSSLVSSEQLHDLPLNGRNIEQLILLAPGVSLVPSSPRGETMETSGDRK